MENVKKIIKRGCFAIAAAAACSVMALGAAALDNDGKLLYAADASADCEKLGWSVSGARMYSNIMDYSSSQGLRYGKSQFTSYFMWNSVTGAKKDTDMTVTVELCGVDTSKYGGITAQVMFIDREGKGELISTLEAAAVCGSERYEIKNSAMTFDDTGYDSNAGVKGDILCMEFDLSKAVPAGKTVTAIEIYPNRADFGMCAVYLRADELKEIEEVIYERKVDSYSAVDFGINAASFSHKTAYFNDDNYKTPYYSISNSASALPAGQGIQITLPKQNIAKNSYPEAAASFEYAASTSVDRIDISKTVFRISTDNGVSWTEVKAASEEITAALNYTAYGIQQPGTNVPIYKISSENIMAAVPAGGRITDIVIAPFGLGSDGANGLDFRFCGAAVENTAAAKKAYEKTADGSDILYHEKASAKSVFSWISSNPKKVISAMTKLDGEDARYIIWPNVNAANSLKEGMHFTVDINDLAVDTAGYDTVTFSFKYALNMADLVDIDISMKGGPLYEISTDNGKSWVKQTAGTAAHKTTSSYFTASSEVVRGMVFECHSEDLKKLADGKTITNIRIYPYAHTYQRAGAFRLYEVSFLGHGADYKAPSNYLGVPVCAKIEDLRKAAVDHMIAMASVEWTPRKTIRCDYPVFGGRTFSVTYNAGTIYKGMAYVGVYDGNLAEFNRYIDNKGVYTPPADVTPYVGNDCTSSVMQAWSLAYPVNVRTARYPLDTLDTGELGVVRRGNYKLGSVPILDTKDVITLNGQDVMFEAYAEMQPGDGIIRNSSGGHMRMIHSVHTVYKEDGRIDGNASYALVIEHAGAFVQSKNSTWAIDRKITFGSLLHENYLPVTCIAFIDGITFEPYLELVGVPDGQDMYENGLRGSLTANYFIDSVTVTVKAENGITVSENYFPSTHRFFSLGMAGAQKKIFPASLENGKYTITATAVLNGKELEAFSYDFVIEK